MTESRREPETEESRMKRKNEYKKKETKNWIISIVLAVVIALSLRFFVFEFIRVDGESMIPTLLDEEYVFMQKVTYYFREPQPGDIVICKFPNRTDTFVKRVVAVEGDVVSITEGILYINGEPNYDFYDKNIGMDHSMEEITIPKDSLFVMGDNRDHSMDSSNSSVGTLTDDMVLGKAEFVIWPLNMMHGLE